MKKILRFVEVQLFVALCSLPILLAWGIPISLASLVGNFVFAPFLTIFLLLSSVLFFCTLTHIPCNLITQCLELITDLWFWCLHWGSRDWLWELPCPPLVVLLILIAASVAIVMYRNFSQYQRIIAFTCLLAGACVALRFWQQEPNTFLVETKGWHSVTIMHSKTHTALIDRGGLQHAGRSWARYKLKPELIKRLGRSNIDYCVITLPRPKTLNGIATLCNTVHVKKVFLPAWQGKGSVVFWNSLGSLRFACRKQGVELLPICAEQLALPWDDQKQLVICPELPLINVEPTTRTCPAELKRRRMMTMKTQVNLKAASAPTPAPHSAEVEHPLS